MDVFRGMFFVLTFFTIGVVSNFKKLWEEGIGRLAAVYVLSFWIYNLGRTADILDLFPRCKTAAGRLIKKGGYHDG